tara:strand:+ start:182 stop:1558 length:1377 start_codon:yes stop_codon:yes gene_type:complete
MKKRIFRIEANSTLADTTKQEGGEFVLGKVDQEFVKFWSDSYQGDKTLEDHILSLGIGDECETTSPPVDKEIFNLNKQNNEWYEIDNFEHIYVPFKGDGFKVTEILNDNERNYKHDDLSDKYISSVVKGNLLYSRDISLIDDESRYENEIYQPALAVLSREKGNFACWFVETNGEDFDPNKLIFGTIKTDFGYFIDSLYYDKVLIEADEDTVEDTVGKGYDCSVGWVKTNQTSAIFNREKIGDMLKTSMKKKVYISKIDVLTVVLCDLEAEKVMPKNDINSIIKILTDFVFKVKISLEQDSEIFILQKLDDEIKPLRLNISENLNSNQIKKAIKNCLNTIINNITIFDLLDVNHSISIAFTISKIINPWSSEFIKLSGNYNLGKIDNHESSFADESSFYIFGLHPEFGETIVTQGYYDGEFDTGILWDKQEEFYGGKRILDQNNLDKEMFTLDYYGIK